MTYDQTFIHRPPAAGTLHAFFQAFPVACFTLTVVTDLAYVQTLNLLWLHLSEWLLLAGLVFGGLGLVGRLIGYLIRRVRPSWPSVVSGVVVLLLAILNSFVHTADGWTAVVPMGLILSILTVLAMVVTGWLGRSGVHHV
jgi:uncharacterized membrane protein